MSSPSANIATTDSEKRTVIGTEAPWLMPRGRCARQKLRKLSGTMELSDYEWGCGCQQRYDFIGGGAHGIVG